jgi:hypothetical protein
MPTGGTSSPAPIRFDDAAPTEGAAPPVCKQCSTPIGTAYYELGGQVFCPACKGRFEAQLVRGSNAGRFAKAAVFGLGGAMVGAGIYYAILALTGYEVGLVAILVGWLVGQAVQRGSGGRGGWAYQVLAVGLTYFAIVSTYVPMIVKEFKEHPTAAAATSSAAATSAPAASPAAATVPDSSAATVRVEQVSLGKAVLALGVLLLIAAAAPFLAGFQNILGILIISFGLYQAWKLNRKIVLAFNGPYAVGGCPAAATATGE